MLLCVSALLLVFRLSPSVDLPSSCLCVTVAFARVAATVLDRPRPLVTLRTMPGGKRQNRKVVNVFLTVPAMEGHPGVVAAKWMAGRKNRFSGCETVTV